MLPARTFGGRERWISRLHLALPSDVYQASTVLVFISGGDGLSLRAVLEEAKLSTSFQVSGGFTAAGSSNWPALFLNLSSTSYPATRSGELDYDGARLICIPNR